MQFRNGKPERFALAFRSGLSLHLHGEKVERRAPRCFSSLCLCSSNS